MLRACLLRRIASVTVIGGGTMGSGIAQVTAGAGIPVTIVEVSESAISKAKKGIETSVFRIAKKQANDDEAKAKSVVDAVMAKVSFSTDLQTAAAQTDLVIEAVVENIDVKQKLWASIDGVAKPSTIFCSNTSSLSIAQQASVTKRAAHFAGLHFFSPVPMMKLVEVVTIDATTQQTKDALLAYSKKIGKVPVLCSDTKGFIVNRLLVPYMLESARLVERGVATVEDVDQAMKLGAGHPMGPFTLCDSVGIDVIKLITDAWHKEEPNNALFNPVGLINQKVAEGKLGRKTGEGFYKYTK